MATVQVCAPSALAIVIDTPFLKESVFDKGTMRVTCEGKEMEGTKWTQLLMMWMLGSNCWMACMVNGELPASKEP